MRLRAQQAQWDFADTAVVERDEAVKVFRLEMSTAIARQPGLTLKFRKMPIDVLVIDRAEKPSEVDK